MNFYGSICLSDIDKSLIRTAENGKKYLSITIRERQNGPDKYGYTHFIRSQRAKSDTPSDGSTPPPNYIGSAKEDTPPEMEAPPMSNGGKPDDGLPF